MSHAPNVPTPEGCVSEPTSKPVFEALPGRLTDLGGLAIRRLLPRSQRRLVGPWCFLDAFGPLSFAGGKPMDVAPHPHIGLQTVSWLLEGEVQHHDSIESMPSVYGAARPGLLNLMTAGRGIAHSEETPTANSGQLAGVQLWVALPDKHRHVEPAFEQHAELPVLDLGAGRATLILGELAGQRAPGRTFSPLVAADVQIVDRSVAAVPLAREFEHALVLLAGECSVGGRSLAPDTLYYLGCGRRELPIRADVAGARALLIGGAPFGENVLMWWNFVAGHSDEIRAARDDWEAGRRFGEVRAYQGSRLAAPAFGARPLAG